MAHTFNVFVAAQRRGVRRVVFASSNHVMGGYKDLPELGDVTPASPPRCGTLLNNPEDRIKSGDAVAYAAAKLAGEQLARALTTVAGGGGRTTFAVLRIGWCQPGANLPSTLNPAGCPPEFQTKTESSGGGGAGRMAMGAAGESVEEAWFKVCFATRHARAPSHQQLTTTTAQRPRTLTSRRRAPTPPPRLRRACGSPTATSCATLRRR